MGGRPWRKHEIALLVEFKRDIPRISKVLGRTEGACRQQLKRLRISIKNGPNSTCVIFPKADAGLRREFVKEILPRVKKALDKCLNAKDLKPEHFDHLIRLIRASASMFMALEKWQTGAEVLDIWKGEVEEERKDADQKKQG